MGERQGSGTHIPGLRAQEEEATEGHTQASQRGGEAHVIWSKAAGHTFTNPADGHCNRLIWAGQGLHTGRPETNWEQPDRTGRPKESKALCLALVSTPHLGRATPR